MGHVPWFAGSAGCVAAVTISMGTLRWRACGGRGGAHGLSRRVGSSELGLAPLVQGMTGRDRRGFQAARRTRTGRPATPPRYVPVHRCLLEMQGQRTTRTTRDPALRTGTTLVTVQTSGAAPTKCSIAQVRDREVAALMRMPFVVILVLSEVLSVVDFRCRHVAATLCARRL